MKFLLDSMLGRLSKWLRIMGYDTHYQRSYKLYEIYELKEERIFVSRNRRLVSSIGGIFIENDRVEDQILELKEKLKLRPDPKMWFTRCILCNALLRKAEPEYAEQFVPEYVLIQNRDRIKFCPICNRFYWPGTHRDRMIKKLKELGF